MVGNKKKTEPYSHPRWHDNPIPTSLGYDKNMTDEEIKIAQAKDKQFERELKKLLNKK